MPAKKSSAKPKTETLKPTKAGEKPITFHPGKLHKHLGVPEGQKIPADKMAAALRGDYGEAARKEAQFKKNVLTWPKK
jgi:hypothetical protein